MGKIPVRARLVDEMHCLAEDGLVVITTQKWQDPLAPTDRPRYWLRLVRNGRVRAVEQFSGERRTRDMAARWEHLAERYRRSALDTNQMWSTLQQLTGIEQAGCGSKNCGGKLPAGGGRCLACGRNERSVASGSLSGIRRRELQLNLRKPR